MSKLFISLLLLSLFCINVQASSVPQINSTGTDGLFSLLSNDALFSSTSNIYNFSDFNIAEGATLEINSSDAVYIYSQQSITINGTLTSSSADLHFIAPAFNFNGTLNSDGNLNVVILGTGSSTPSAPDISNGVVVSSNLDTTLTTGFIEAGTITTGDFIFPIFDEPTLVLVDNGNTVGPIVIINPSPVPLPGALWLMISGILSFGLLKKPQ